MKKGWEWSLVEGRSGALNKSDVSWVESAHVTGAYPMTRRHAKAFG